jgi:hypothetical protein
VSAISKIQPNNFQLAAHVVQASKEHDDHIKRRKTNLICWECGIKGHYSNECPDKRNATPKPIAHARKRVKTKDSVKPSLSKDPTNVLSSLGGNPITTNIGRVRNSIIIEDSVKGLYSLNFRRGRKQPYKPPGSNFGNLKTRREEKDQSS